MNEPAINNAKQHIQVLVKMELNLPLGEELALGSQGGVKDQPHQASFLFNPSSLRFVLDLPVLTGVLEQTCVCICIFRTYKQ